jgi:VCBS repeat-containing protein
MVTLPANVSLDAIHVEGRDLVIALPDGTTLVIVDGAIYVPQLVLNGVEIPAINVAALLIGQEPQPAAGLPQSSGGNFAVPVGGIGPGIGIGDLLPPTALSFSAPEFRELEAALDDDDQPGISIITPQNPAGAINATASVDEAGLPARPGESPGSEAAANSEITTGTIVFTALDTPATISINNVLITGVGQTVTTADGVLAITAIRDGAIDYQYTLADNTSGDNTSDLFTVVVTDEDGDTAQGTLTVAIVDDVPTALPDIDSVTAGAPGGTVSQPASVDFDSDAAFSTLQPGGQAMLLPGLTLEAVGGVLDRFLGVSVLSPSDGAPGQGWTREIDAYNDNAEGLRLTFAAPQSQIVLTLYQLYQERGFVPTPNVEKVNLTVRFADGSSTTLSVAATQTAQPGEAIVTLDASAFAGRTILGVDLAPDLSTPTLAADASQAIRDTYNATHPFSEFTLKGVTYTVASTTPPDISIADGNVLTGTGGTDPNATDGIADVLGADGATVTGVGTGFSAVPVGNIGVAFAGNYGALTLNADGSYSYLLDNQNAAVSGLQSGGTLVDRFTYTVTDGDGDQSSATLTITIDGRTSMLGGSGISQMATNALASRIDAAFASSSALAATLLVASAASVAAEPISTVHDTSKTADAADTADMGTTTASVATLATAHSGPASTSPAESDAGAASALRPEATQYSSDVEATRIKAGADDLHSHSAQRSDHPIQPDDAQQPHQASASSPLALLDIGEIALPSEQKAPPGEAQNVQPPAPNSTVAEVVADALHGGAHSPDLHALLDSLAPAREAMPHVALGGDHGGPAISGHELAAIIAAGMDHSILAMAASGHDGVTSVAHA